MYKDLIFLLTAQDRVTGTKNPEANFCSIFIALIADGLQSVRKYALRPVPVQVYSGK
jgi:hypothetical protein